MPQQPVASVWNDVRITSNGISVRLYSEGETAVDTDAPDWSDSFPESRTDEERGDLVTVVGYADKQADEYVIGEEESGEDMTVADVNDCDPEEPVVEAVYNSRDNNRTYAFPESRLEPVEET